MIEPFPSVFKRPFIGLLSEKLTFEASIGALNVMYNPSVFEKEYGICNQYSHEGMSTTVESLLSSYFGLR